MKKILKLLFILACVGMMTLVVFGEVYTGSCGTGVNWELDTETGVMAITGEGHMGDFMFGNYPTWQNYKDSIKSITVGSGVKSIGQLAFEQCNNLETVTLGNGVEEIRQGAFYECPNLKGISIPKSLKGIYNYVTWLGCESLTHIYVNNISSWCAIDFYGPNETSGNPLKTGTAELYNIFGQKIVNLTIPEGVTEVRTEAFNGFSGTSIKIPSTLSKIGKNAFICPNVTDVYISDLKAWCNIDFESSVSGGNLYCNDNIITHLVIPEDVTNIPDFAFAGFTCLESVTIPDTVESIGNNAFENCTNLKNVTIGNNVTSIGNNAFSGCSTLEEIVISDSVANIGSGVFSGCDNLIEVVIPDSVKTIGTQLFFNCSKLENIVVGNGIESLSEGCFSGCTSLEKITIGSGIKNIGKNAFLDCENLLVVNLKDIGAWCEINFEKAEYSPLYNGAELYYCNEKITKLVIPEGTEYVGNYCFYNCSYITEIVIADSVKTFSTTSFDCEDLIKIDFGNGIEQIPDKVFQNHTKLTTVNFGNNIKNIGNYSFSGCSLISEISIPDHVETVGKYAFQKCTGVIKVVIGDGVGTLSEYAFYNCNNMTTVVFNGSLKQISKYSFANCTKLNTIVFPDTPIYIDEYAFSSCNSLTYVDISDIKAWCETTFNGYGANPIYYGADLYIEDEKLIDIVVPNGTKKIGDYAFYDYDSLRSISLPESLTVIGYYAFAKSSSLELINISDGISQIGVRAFYDCTALKTININSIDSWIKINFLDQFANPLFYALKFYIDDELVEHVIIPDGITTLPVYAFYHAMSVKSVVIPKSLTSIPSIVFYSCNKIDTIYYKGTAEEWNNFSIGRDNGSLSTATVYTDYTDNSFKIIFDANTDDYVKNIPGKTSAYGTFKIPEDIPLRAGFEFVGWSVSPQSTEVCYKPDDVVEILNDVCFYAIWKNASKYTIDTISFLDASYNTIESIPNMTFFIETTVTNIAHLERATILIATYDTDGRMLDIDFLYANPQIGQTVTFGTQIKNSDGKVAKVKAFVISDLKSFSSLAEAKEITKV